MVVVLHKQVLNTNSVVYIFKNCIPFVNNCAITITITYYCHYSIRDIMLHNSMLRSSIIASIMHMYFN